MFPGHKGSPWLIFLFSVYPAFGFLFLPWFPAKCFLRRCCQALPCREGPGFFLTVDPEVISIPDYKRVAGVPVSPFLHDDGFCANIFYDNHTRTPTMAAVIWFVGGQRYPADGGTGTYPTDPSRIPGESDMEGRRTESDADSGGRRSPVPEIVYQHPISIVVG